MRETFTLGVAASLRAAPGRAPPLVAAVGEGAGGEDGPPITQDDAWAVVNSYVRERGLVRQQLDRCARAGAGGGRRDAGDGWKCSSLFSPRCCC